MLRVWSMQKVHRSKGLCSGRKVLGAGYRIKLPKKPSPVVLQHFGNMKLLANQTKAQTSALVYSDAVTSEYHTCLSFAGHGLWQHGTPYHLGRVSN